MDEGGYSFIKSVSMMLNKLPACSVGIDLGDWSGNQARWLKKAKIACKDISQDCCELWRPYFLRLRLNEIQVPDSLVLLLPTA